MSRRTIDTYENGELVKSEARDMPPEVANRDALHERVGQALDPLRAYVTAPNPTAAQTAAIVKVLCRVVIALVRLRLEKFDGTE